MKSLFITILGMLVISFDSIGIKLSPLFSHNMILQRNSNITLFGEAIAGEKIIITPSWSNKSYSTTTKENGKWSLDIATSEAGEGYSIIIEAETSTITLNNVALGEVWLCSGQSNMYWTPADGLVNYEQEVAEANYPNIRFFSVPTFASNSEPQEEIKSQWQICTSKTMDHFSCVGYFFARELLNYLHIPIGVINASWGGGNIEQFIKADLIEHDSLFIHSAKKNCGWRDWMVAQSDDLQKKLIKKKDSEEISWYGTIYNGMIYPLQKYKIAGVLWYQGESQRVYPYAYASLMKVLIDSWRNAWGYDFPFYSVQIAPFRDEQNRYILQHPLVVEQQIQAAQYHNCGIIPTNDIGDIHNIHPTNKQEVGKRLALLALGKHYKQIDRGYQSPMYKSYQLINDTIVIQLEDIKENGGLVIDGDSIKGMQIAGEDKIFHDAYCKINKKENYSISVWSPKVRKPVAVRYCFLDVGIGNLFNKNKWPVSPFRTDQWEIE